MKTKLILRFAALGVVFTAELHAQPTAFTYQGQLIHDGSPANGFFDIAFSVWTNAIGPSQIGPMLTNATAVSNGLFTVTLDFGAGVFDGSDRWLEISVATNGSGSFSMLSPRHPITATPYASHAFSVNGTNITGTVPMANLPPNLVRSDDGTVEWTGLVRFLGPVEFDQSSGPPFAVVSSSDLVAGLNAELLGGRPAQGFWQTDGNAGTTPGTNFVGTTDNQPLVLKVNNQRALVLSPKGDSWTSSDGEPDGAVNVVAGSPVNHAGWSSALSDAVGVTISGGGATNLNGAPRPNRASGDYSTIGGGVDQNIEAEAAFASIGGGEQNAILTGSEAATIGGGVYNWIEGHAYNAVIAGGAGNVIGTNSAEASIGGGVRNKIEADARSARIGAGYENWIQTNAAWATIGGGIWNEVQAGAQSAVIGGGVHNNIAQGGTQNVIGGGDNNSIRAGAYSAAVGGGANNLIEAPFATIAGGEMNEINYSAPFFANHAVIAGGNANNIWGADEATIAGGSDNGILEGASGACIGGGFGNTVLSNALYATIPGGYGCRVGNDAGYAFAAGRAAYTLHPGTFVWADASEDETAPFASSSSNQFLIRATGGVGINTTNPATALDVRVLGSEAASVHVGGEGVNGLSKLIYFGDMPYVSIGEQGVDDQMVLTAGSFYFDNNSGSGRVGLGRFATANKLEVEGDASKTTAGSWLANSDRRIKRDIRSLTNAIETLARVRPVSFRYTEAYRTAHPGIADRDYVNVVAQEFEHVFPDYVKSGGESSPEGGGEEIRQVDTYPLLIYGTAAIQELNQKLEHRSQEAEGRIQKLEAENAELKARLKRLEQLVARQFAKAE